MRLKARWWALITMIWLAALMPAASYAAEYTIGPAPAWVVPTMPGFPSADAISQGSYGEVYLLTDSQVLAGDQQRVTYHRLVTTAINASGVSAVANIQISFDPSYQTLVLHSINIVRHGHVIAKLATARIQVLQREAELEARIYDGTKTVSVALDDVREGDTVDYSYSTTGRNPVFKGLDFGRDPLQFAVPIARIHMRLLVPQDKHVTFAERNTAIKPVVSEHNGLRDYVWDVTNPPVLKVENDAPLWYMPYAEAAWSEFADWAAVARWAQPLYQVPASLSPELQAQVDRIAKAEPTSAGRMLAVLRLVQSEVRYLGVEIGQNSHAPNPPDLVYARRFGDCKDKTLLTLTLLDRLGIEAHAALVNTSLQRGLADLLPSPGLFDHVLVQARLDGKTWWIDPTRYTQKADLAHLYQPDYGLALIVGSATQALTPMKRADKASAARQLNVVFDASAGFDKPVRYTLETTITGVFAEALRARLTTINASDAEKTFLNFRATRYPHVKLAAPLQIKDDEAANRIVIKETYTIADMVTPSGDGKQRVADIILPDISQVMREPSATDRKSPLHLAYPQDVSQHTEILLPANWPLKPSNATIDDPAFHFEQTVLIDGARVTMLDHYQALTDEVPAQDMPRYVSNLARARNSVGYELSWGKTAAATTTTAAPATQPSTLDRMNWPLVMLTLGIFAFWPWMAFKAYRYDPPPSVESDPRWQGIGGWLLLLTVLLALRPLVYGSSLLHLVRILFSDKWAQLTTYGSHSYHALYAPTMLLELTDAVAQLTFSLLLLLLLFQRRSSFPRVALLVIVSGVIVHLGDVGLASMVPIKNISLSTTKAVWNVIGTVVWSAYLLQSRRVKATFVRRYRASMSPPLSQLAEQVS
ncbi:transglutaminase [Dyella flagellata]|uniref:Transglutaminase n=1 Tax=Dyella flagellata TaxID=1867833 RepID=A0ABQ5XI09_9GAMM|nr:transglutaminase [Dyella flagellata]